MRTFLKLMLQVAGLTAAFFIASPAATLFAAGVTVPAGSQLLINSATLTVPGDISNSGTVGVTSGSIVLTGNLSSSGIFNCSAGAVTFNGSSGQDLNSSSGNFNNLTFSGSGSKTNSGTATAAVLTVTGVTLTNNGALTASSSLTGTGSLIQGGGSTLNLGGTVSISTFDASVDSNTVDYNGAVQTVLPITYHHLTLSGSNTKTQSSALTVNGDLNVSAGVTLNSSASLSVSGTANVAASGILNTANTISITGTSSISGTLTVSSTTGTKTFGSITINTGGLVNCAVAEDLAINGNLQVDGTGSITSNNGAWAFQKTGGGTISGTAASASITNPTFSTAYSISLPFTAGTLTADAAVTNNNIVTAATSLAGSSSFTQGNGSTLNIGGTVSVSVLNTSVNANLVNYNGGAQSLTEGSYYNLTCSGSGAKNNAGTVSVGNTLTVAGVTLTNNGTVSVTSSLTGSGTFAQGNGSTLNIGGTADVTTLNASVNSNLVNYNGGVQGVNAGTYHNLVCSGSGAKTNSGIIVANGTLTVTGVTFTNNGTATVVGSLTGTGTVTQGSGSTLNIGGDASIATLNASVNSNLVNYNGASQDLNAGNYYNLTCSGSGTKTSSGTIAASGTLTITDVNFVNNATVTAAGSFTGTGTFTQGDGATLNIGGTCDISTLDASADPNLVNYNGADQDIKIVVYHHLTFSGSGVKTADGALTINGNIIISANVDFHGGSYTHDIYGDWTNAGGIFTPGSSTIVFCSVSADQTITGSVAVQVFNNLTVDKAGYKLSVSGSIATLTLGGTLTIDAGTFEAGTAANIEVGGDWINNTGSDTAFTAGSGTVTATGSADRDYTGSTIFNDLTFDDDAIHTITAGTVLIVNGTLALSGSGDIVLNTGTIDCKGDIDITNTGVSGGGSATLLIDGTLGQSLSSSVALGQGSLPKIEINKSSGDLNLSGTITITNDWTYTAGTVVPGTSTVVFADTLTISGSMPFNNVTFNNAVAYTITPASTISLAGTLLLSDGSLATGAIDAAGAITLSQDFDGGSTALNITGTAVQTLTGGGSATTGDCLPINIDKTGGSLTLSGVIRTTNDWTYTAGSIITTGSTLAFAPAVNLDITPGNSINYNNITFNGAGSATLTAGSTLNTTGILTLTSGTVNTGTISASGSSINLETGFGGGSTVLSLTGSAAQALTGGASGSSLPLEINKSGGTLAITPGGIIYTSVLFNSAGATTIASGSTMNITGLLTFNSGTVNTGTIDAQGDITLATGFSGGTTALNITGNSAQVLTGAGSDTLGVFLPVTINKSGSTLTLSGIIRTTDDWTYTAGTVDAGSSTVVFADALTISGSMTFNNMTFNNTVSYNIAGGSTVGSSGTLALTAGTITGGTIAASGNVTLSQTFTGGTTALDITGTAIQTFTGAGSDSTGDCLPVTINKTGGSVTLADTIRTTHDWTYTAGTVTVGTSTVVFAGALTISGDMPFNNVTFNTASAYVIAPSSTISVSGTLDLADGTLATGAIDAKGNITLSQNFDGGTTGLTITGTAAQILTGGGSASSGYFLPVTINKTGGTLTLADTIRTTNDWTYTAGTVVPGTSTVVFADTLTISGSMPFNNVTFNNAVAYTITPSSTITVGGILDLSDGSLTTGNIDAQGSITLSQNFDGGSTALNITGSSDQVLTGGGSASSGYFLPVTINKTGGTLTLANTIRTTSDWTYTAGAVSVGTSTVVFAGALTISGNMPFNNVTFSNAVTYTVTPASVLEIGGTLNLTRGVINGGTIDAQGNVTLTTTFSGGTTVLNINGAGDQTITGAGSTALGDCLPVNINKTGGTLTLSGVIRTTNDWTYTAGNVNVGSSTLAFASSLTVDPGTISYNNIAFTGVGSNYTITSGQTLYVGGTLTLSAGAVNTGSIDAKGNISLGQDFSGGTAVLNITGTAVQTLTGAGSDTTGDCLPVVINKTGGSLTLADTIRTGHNWTYTAGAVNAGTSTVVFAINPLTISGSMSFYNLTFDQADTNFTISSGTTLTTTGLLHFASGYANTGDLNASRDVQIGAGAQSGSAVLTMSGTSDQLINCLGGDANQTINVSNSGNIVSVNGNSSLYNMNLQAGTLKFLPGFTHEIHPSYIIATSSSTTIDFTGSSGNLVTLRSSTSGSRWKLNVSSGGLYIADWVDVQDSDASGGRKINALNSTNSGNNRNWFFEAKLVFTTAVQHITKNLSSSVITVQVQTGNGEPMPVGADTRIDLATTSSTGIFATSQTFGDLITYVTIPADSSSADFYYRDSTPGQYTISAAEDPDEGWPDPSQDIFVESKGGFKYKVAIAITSVSALSDYQMLVTYDTASLIAAGKMNADCSDMRFYDYDDSTVLYYWIEEGTENNSATRIWVKVPSIPAGGKFIYMYYGNSTAVSASDISNTFILGDDFSSTTVNNSKWNTRNASSGIFSSTGDELKAVNTGTAATGRLKSQGLFTAPFVLESSVRVPTLATDGVQTLGLLQTAINCFGVLASSGGTPTRYYLQNDDLLSGPYNSSNLFSSQHRETITASGASSVSIDLGSGSYTQSVTNSVSNEAVTLGRRYDDTGDSEAYECYWDWVLVRKYAASDPTPTPGPETKSITQLQITTSVQTLRQNQSSTLMTVQTQGYDGTTVNVSVDTTIRLSSSSAGGFFAPEDDPANWNEDSLDIVIHAGQNSASFYYKDSVIGTPTVTALDNPSVGWNAATQVETIVSAVNHFDVAVTTPQVAGANFTLTITARDDDGNISTEYSDPVNMTVNYVDPLTGSGVLSVLTTSAFTNGIATINNESFSDCGTVAILVTKADDATKTGVSANIVFLPYDFVIQPENSQNVINAGFSLTVTARNLQGQVCPNYMGDTNLTAVYVAPAEDQAGTFTPAQLDSTKFEAGIATVTAAYNKWGTIKIKASDATDATREGQSADMVFIPKDFSLSLSSIPASRKFYYKDEEFTASVTARDENGATVANYQGTVELSSSDRSVSETYTFLLEDNGSHSFTVSIPSSGTLKMTVQDADYDQVTGSTGNFEVKEAQIKVFSTAGPLGTVPVTVKVLDMEDNIITEDDSTTFLVTLSEPNNNHTASSDSTAVAARIQGGNATIYILDTEAESVTITPNPTPGLTVIPGMVNFGSFQGRGIGIDTWREVK